MADIIPIRDKLAETRKRTGLSTPRRKQLAVRQALKRSSYSGVCEKCGGPLGAESGEAPGAGHSLRVPYQFCTGCAEEYVDYVERLKGAGDPECYWRNESWMAVWQTWIQYRGAMDRHLKSKEFVRLIQELKSPPSE